ncbi:MAG: phosphate ABC transporter permease PstA [Phycisphaerales bacterium]|nr:phosphate ABC transporter permease PstA [Phycisphaerales bacterium]
MIFANAECAFEPRLARRRLVQRVVVTCCVITTLVGIAVLAVLLAQVAWVGGGRLGWRFLSNFPSTLFPEKAGCRSALVGSLWTIVLTGLFAVPIGIAAAIYLHEYAPRNRWTRIIELNIANLAGVPSIMYGLLGLTVFVRMMSLGRSVLAGALTLALLVLPPIIIASREALAAVPDSIRLASISLGATRWQTIWSHVLPAAIPGIMTGIILAISRAAGEAAPLLLLSGVTYITFVPHSLLDPFTVLPLQIFSWTEDAQTEFHELAAAGILVLLAVLLTLNAAAIAIRAAQQRRQHRW